MSKNVFVTFGSYHSLNIVLLNIGNLTKKKNISHGKIYSSSQEEKMSNRTLLCNKLTKKNKQENLNITLRKFSTNHKHYKMLCHIN